MKNQMVFKRHEIKYLLTREQKTVILGAIENHMKPDSYAKSAIRNVYFDTDQFRLIRRSMEKPVYKEKLRVRSYGRATENEDVFVEIKKKYRGVVYKRRLLLPQNQAMKALISHHDLPCTGQIAREINYFCQYYKSLKPVVFISYDREAWYGLEDQSLRVTFDENICYRSDRLSLTEEAGGFRILPEGLTLMEIKTAGAIPLWLTRCLTEEKIYKATFSKYGEAYRHMCSVQEKGVCVHV